jgi:hypothetical protein
MQILITAGHSAQKLGIMAHNGVQRWRIGSIQAPEHSTDVAHGILLTDVIILII